jgi:hypothetical protein
MLYSTGSNIGVGSNVALVELPCDGFRHAEVVHRETDRDCYAAGCTNRTTLRCSRCEFALYCSAECQQTDWREHREACAAMRLR